MKLSALQKYILTEAYGHKKVDRKLFNKFYLNKKVAPKGEDRIKIISKSIDRLIDKGLMFGYGQKTKHKWYIKEVSLTALGKTTTKKLLGEQTSLPFKKKKAISKKQKIK